MEFEKMSENLQRILMQAVNDAKAHQHASVDTIDVLEAIFKDEALNGLFDRLNVDKKLLCRLSLLRRRILSNPTQPM